MPPDEVEKIARFRELSPAQKALMLSARKAGKFTEGVILSKSLEVHFRAVPPSLYLALAQTEPEEKAERYQLMQQHGISELDAPSRWPRRSTGARHRVAGLGPAAKPPGTAMKPKPPSIPMPVQAFRHRRSRKRWPGSWPLD